MMQFIHKGYRYDTGKAKPAYAVGSVKIWFFAQAAENPFFLLMRKVQTGRVIKIMTYLECRDYLELRQWKHIEARNALEKYFYIDEKIRIPTDNV